MTSAVALFVLLILADLALWLAAALMPLGETGRFRARAAAAVLLFVLLGSVVGWQRATILGMIGLWVAAIVVSSLPGKASPA